MSITLAQIRDLPISDVLSLLQAEGLTGTGVPGFDRAMLATVHRNLADADKYWVKHSNFVEAMPMPLHWKRGGQLCGTFYCCHVKYLWVVYSCLLSYRQDGWKCR